MYWLGSSHKAVYEAGSAASIVIGIYGPHIKKSKFSKVSVKKSNWILSSAFYSKICLFFYYIVAV